MSLVEHAKAELALLDNDKAFNDAIIAAVEGFASYGHSGGSASYGIALLNDLLQYNNASPLTDDPAEWNKVADNLWQSKRNPAAFSSNGGEFYWLVSEANRDLKASKSKDATNG